jgi:hypothetical protein
MQFIEKNSFNVRSAICLLKNENCGIEFRLFPMVHIGSKDFYNHVSEKLSECDLILAEGVKSKKGNILTFSYSIVKKIKRMDLITQKEGLNLSVFADKIRNTDIKGQDFDDNWSTLSIVFRLSLFVIIPFYVVYLYAFGTREIIAKHIAVDDLPTSDEVLFSDQNTEELEKILIDKRDKVLIESIEELIQENKSNPTQVGILYGAFHMRNIFDYLLNKKNYKIVESEWLTVFEF